MQPIQFFAARAEDGALLPGATVDVFVHGTEQRATLFSDSSGSVPLVNPAYADANARVLFYTSTEKIDIRISRFGYVAPLLVDISTLDVAAAVEQVRGQINAVIEQMEQEFDEFLWNSRYESVYLIYGAGLVVSRQTQLIQRGGELYRVLMPADLPTTLTGNWAIDAPKLAAVGDAVLRQELSGPNGSTMVHHGAITVSQALAGVDTLTNQIFSSDQTAITLPMHFGPLRGRGWTAGDPPWSAENPGNVKSTTATGPVGTTSFDIPVESATNFAAGMLICYLGVDGEYYSAKLHSILAGPIFRLGEALPQAIAAGAPLYNFYRDDAHPNTFGGAAIVDDAIRRLREFRVRELEFRSFGGAIWEPVLGAEITSLASTSYSNPGGAADGERGIVVASNVVNAGVQSRLVSLTGGDYVVSFPLNVGLRSGGFSGAVEVYIDEYAADGNFQTIATSGTIVGYDCIRLVEVNFSCRPGSMIKVRITSGNSGGFSFYLGLINYFRLSARVANVNRGKHVLFGDSWVSQGSPMAARFVERLDKADVVVKGVPGNFANQMLARFYSDVVPEAPNYIWFVVSTNDYYGGTTSGLFEQQVLQLRRLAQSVGAQPIFFDATVGAITFSPEKLTPSRVYALRVRYEDIATQTDGAGVGQRSANFQGQGLALPAGVTQLVGVIPGTTRSPAVLRSVYLNQSNLEVIVDYPSAVDGAGAVDQSTYGGAATIRDKIAPRPTDVAPRHVAVRLRNPTGGVVNVSYAFDVCWNQDR